MSEHLEGGDDIFHLTPVDVRRYDFGSAMRGYDRQRVDQFREQLAEELERLIRVSGELEAKVRNVHEQLKHYRERDKAINEALVSAQQLREEVKEQAAREAELMRREAEAAAQQIVAESRQQIATLQGEIEQLDRARRAYLAQLRAIAERHIAEADALMQHPQG
ncbi:MAG TPA: DivIVA domain-containing protein [Gemmatimonadaceae bacterium]|nr:DivIVA domain-containing protein [Gemmatimonadaceae bacterium]